MGISSSSGWLSAPDPPSFLYSFEYWDWRFRPAEGRGAYLLSGHSQCPGLAISTPGLICPFPWAHLDPVVKTILTEVGVQVSREASPQVFVHGRIHLGLFTLGCMSLPFGGGDIHGQGLELLLDWPGKAVNLPWYWRLETRLAWACGSSWASAANSHISAHIWPSRHRNFPMASSSAGAKA